MRVFSRVIAAGSFAGAARELKLSPAVVTRLVADLEDHLGARLIHRTTRRLALTDTGELYLERVQHILAEVEEAEAQASAATAQPRGHLRVLAPPAFASHGLARQLPDFLARHPQVTLELRVAGPGQGVDEACDLSIVAAELRPAPGDGVVHVLGRCDDIVCAAPAYLERRGRPMHPQELAGHDGLFPAGRPTLNFMPEAAGSDPAVTLVPPRSALNTTHVDTLCAAARAGLGVTALPAYVVNEALREHQLERLLPGWRLTGGGLCAVLPARPHLPARTRALVDFLLQAFGGVQ